MTYVRCLRLNSESVFLTGELLESLCTTQYRWFTMFRTDGSIFAQCAVEALTTAAIFDIWRRAEVERNGRGPRQVFEACVFTTDEAAIYQTWRD
jgi:hypothetical protein